MRICVVSSFPPTLAGVADYGAHLAHHFARDSRVSAVTVVADRPPRAPATERHGRLAIQRVWTRDSLGTGRELLRAVHQARPDVVWFNLGLTMFGTRMAGAAGGLLAPLYTRLLGYRTVVTLHELPALVDLVELGVAARHRRLGVSAVPHLMLRTDLVVVTLGRYHRYLVSRHRAANVRHIPHGAYGEPQPASAPAQEAVLVFGTFGPHKDPGLVADAVTQLHRRGRPVQLIVAGTDHPRYPGFMARCRVRHHLNGSWIGYVPPERLSSLFARASLVVVPSRASTGSSGVIYRALSHGRAVLASDLPDHRGLAEDEGLELGWFRPADGVSLANALERLLDDQVGRHRMVRQNLAAMKRLDPARTVDAYLAEFGNANARVSTRGLAGAELLSALEAGGAR